MASKHLGRSSIAFRITISLSGLHSDGRQMGVKWEPNAYYMLICASNHSFMATGSIVIARIMQLADWLDISSWLCQDHVPRQ